MRMNPQAAVAFAEPAGGVEDRNALVVQHLALVKSIARRLSQRVPSQVELNELISAGMVALVDAAGRYRPALNVPFEAYARRRVQGAMLDSLRSLDGMPRSARKLRRDLDTAINRLRHELKREPDDREIAAALGHDAGGYARMLQQLQAADVGAVRQVDGGGEGGMLELAIDPEESAQVRLERAEIRSHLAAAIAELPERERQILALYYQEELTLGEVGAVIGVGESRVSQLRTQAIARLRARLRETLQRTEMR